MSSSSFARCQAGHYYYIKKFNDSFIILILYVNDRLIVGSNMQ